MINNYEPIPKMTTTANPTPGIDDVNFPKEPESIQRHAINTYSNLCTLHRMLDSIDRLLIGNADKHAAEQSLPESLRANCAINFELTNCLIHRIRDIATLLGVEE